MVIVCAGTARADGLDGERFVPATGAEGGFVLEPPAVPAHLGWSLGLFMNVADNQVVQRTGGMIDTRPLDTAFSTDLLASLGLFNRLELGVGLPLHLVYEGDTYTTGGTTLAASSGVGDLRFVPKVAIVRAGGVATHSLLSFALPVTFPTGNETALRGQGGYTIEPRLLFGIYLGRIGLSFDAGYRWRSEHSPTLPWGDEITFGGGLAFAATRKLTLRAEVYAAKEVHEMVGGADFPFELLGGLDYAINNSWDLYAGAALGVTDGIGDPRVRVVLGIRYRHNVTSSGEGFKDSDGDGILDKDDQCPNEPEDMDGFQDADGCPERDNDGDGIPDDEDECPEFAGDAAHHGCPAKTFVRIEEGRIYIFGKVQFQTGSHHIDRASDPLLDQIAEALNANPQVKHVRIEGHTDNVGGTGMNQHLSEERAGSVKEALEKRGVDGGRLSTRGYGESRPIAPNRAPAGRAKNRRVEFIIAERQR